MIAPSPLHGFGVFAARAIDVHHAIGWVHVQLVHPHAFYRNGPPLTSVLVHGVRAAVLEGFPLWYVNYSDHPNVKLVADLRNPSLVHVAASRPIHVGEELTLLTWIEDEQGGLRVDG